MSKRSKEKKKKKEELEWKNDKEGIISRWRRGDG